MSELLFQ